MAFVQSSINLLKEYLLSTYYVLYIVLGTVNIAVKKSPALIELDRVTQTVNT